MPLLDVIDHGRVVIRALLDENDNIIDSTGPDAGMIEDLERRGNATGRALTAKFAFTSSVAEKEGDELIPISDDENKPAKNAVDSINAAMERARRNKMRRSK